MTKNNKLEYVCLSDLHLGAGYSVLTGMDTSTGAVRAGRSTPTLDAFGKALRHSVAELAGDEPVTLILLGDVLDMAMSPIDETATAFQTFMKALFPEDSDRPFGERVICIPGNHDHHLWQLGDERRVLERLATVQQNGSEHRPQHITRMFEEPHLKSVLLTELMQQLPNLGGAAVDIAYPNYALASADGTRSIVFHHGHFIESFYRLMSEFTRFVDRGSPPLTAERLEQENATWIDFVWSTFGETGELGRDIVSLYGILQSGSATNRYLGVLAGRLIDRFSGVLPLAGETEIRDYAKMGTKGLLDVIAGRVAQLERNQYLSVLAQASIDSLHWYLNDIVWHQARLERPDWAPAELSFVFGHTHKPFEDLAPLSRYTRPVQVFNTGGWVQDEPKFVSCEGAAAMFIDRDLNIASLRLFNQPVNEEPEPVTVRDPGSTAKRPNPMADALAASIAAGRDTWHEFSLAAAADLDLRRRLLARALHRPIPDPAHLAGGLA